jgi:hypothetical protein
MRKPGNSVAAPAAVRVPYLSYASLIALGMLPTALVTQYYAILPHRLVVQWETMSKITVIGTRPATVLMVANIAAAIALIGTAIAVWQHRMLSELGMRRPFFGLNAAQVVAINLLCAMIVSDALGLQLRIKPAIAPAMAVALFAAGMLAWRIHQGNASKTARAAAFVLLAGAVLFLAAAAVSSHSVVGYFASALAVLAMAAVALPERG